MNAMRQFVFVVLLCLLVVVPVVAWDEDITINSFEFGDWEYNGDYEYRMWKYGSAIGGYVYGGAMVAALPFWRR